MANRRVVLGGDAQLRSEAGTYLIHQSHQRLLSVNVLNSHFILDNFGGWSSNCRADHGQWLGAGEIGSCPVFLDPSRQVVESRKSWEFKSVNGPWGFLLKYMPELSVHDDFGPVDVMDILSG